MYIAQEIPQIDTEIAQKGHFRMETKQQLICQSWCRYKQLCIYVENKGNYQAGVNSAVILGRKDVGIIYRL